MTVVWKGVFPAVTTKFTKDFQLDIKAFQRNINAQLEAGVHGIVLGGTLGEASVLNSQEKSDLLRATHEVVSGRVPIIMNIAEQVTSQAANEVKKFQSMGVNGFMLLPPMRYSPDENETLSYIKEVAGSTDLPIMIYNNPVDYKTLISLDMFEKLSGVKNIQAVKESTRDVTNVTRMINRFGDRYSILCGVDTIAMESIVMGANGWVAGLVCAFPDETVRIYNLIQEGQYESAREIFRWFLPLLELDIHPKLVQYIKLAETMTCLGTETVRPPRLPLAGEERTRVLAIINNALEHRPQLLKKTS
jgi:dihydrodipicolinate synthase/N-acetylneuraminate lyase